MEGIEPVEPKRKTIMDHVKTYLPMAVIATGLIVSYTKLEGNTNNNSTQLEKTEAVIEKLAADVSKKSDSILLNQEALKQLLKDSESNEKRHEKNEGRHEYLRRLVNELKTQHKVNTATQAEQMLRIEKLLLDALQRDTR